MRKILFTAALISAVTLSAQQQGRDEFMKRQAYDEMQRVSGLVEIIQSNLSDVERRVGMVEKSSQSGQLRAEIDALKASVDSLRREMSSMRAEIVKDLSQRIASLQPPPKKKPAEQVEKNVYSGPCLEYTVQSGDSLYMIAQAFSTTISEIKAMNKLKSNNLKVGQKLLVPKK